MIIRNERPSDYHGVEHLTREAFWNKYKPGCDEHFVLHVARKHPAFVPQLDLVLESDRELIAHIMYCRVEIERDDGGVCPALLFGPVSVLPSYQRQGYGSRLIEASLNQARDLGYGAVLIQGSPDYYHRFGFRSATDFSIYLPGMERTDEAAFSMALELQSGYLTNVCGVLRIPAFYTVDPIQLEAYDKSFPPKIKLKLPGQLA